VRIGHKTRVAALDELNDQIDLHAVRRILTEIGYEEALREDDQTEARLAAYYVSAEPLTASELRAHLAERLPAYMLPSHFVRLDRLPLTPHGKLDRAALPSPEASRPELAAAYVAPRGVVEERIAAIWADVLKVARIGARDEFLDLGGHSLVAIQIISRVNQAFGVDLPLASAFEASTVAALARLVEEILLREIEALSDEEVERQATTRGGPRHPNP
jgi:acyl carrier protein